MKKLILIFLLGIHPGTLLAQPKNYSVGPAPRDNSSKAERASFRIAKGYTVSLFASEQDGVANPIAMRWGPKPHPAMRAPPEGCSRSQHAGKHDK